MAGKESKAEIPSTSTSPISMAPPASAIRSGSANQFTVDTIRDAKSPKSLYWAGTLLMEGTFDWETPATLEEVFGGVVSEDNSGEFRKTVKRTAEQLWYPPAGARFWAARNRYYQQLDVAGMSFPAFTQIREGDATNEDQIHTIVYPGHVFPMSDRDVANALEHVKNHAIRPSGPPWRSFPGAMLVNYMHGHMPGCKGGRLLVEPSCDTCRQLERDLPQSATIERPRRNTPIEHRLAGDLPMADYVYLLRLDAPWDTPKAEYINLVRSMREFFRNQPPALSRDLGKVEEKAA